MCLIFCSYFEYCVYVFIGVVCVFFVWCRCALCVNLCVFGEVFYVCFWCMGSCVCVCELCIWCVC